MSKTTEISEQTVEQLESGAGERRSAALAGSDSGAPEAQAGAGGGCDAAAACDLLAKHYRMQLGNFITQCDEEPWGWRVFSEISAVPMWNHTAFFQPAPEHFQKDLASLCRQHNERGRRPTVYLMGESPATAALERCLAENGFEAFDRESWMVYDPGPAARATKERKLEVRQAATEAEMADFVAVFYAAYQVREKTYAEVLKRQLTGLGAADRIMHWVGYADGKPVSIATLMESGGAGCIYNVGTLPEARKRGFGRAVMEQVIERASASGHQPLFLQVDCGSATEQLYERLGFKRIFTRRGYRLKEWSVEGRSAIDFFPLSAPILGLDRPEESGRAQRERLCFEIPAAAQEMLARRAGEMGLDSAVIVLSAWALMLSRYSGQEEVEFGASWQAAGRKSGPVRIKVPDDAPASAWWKELESQLGRGPATAGAGGGVAESWVQVGALAEGRRGLLMDVCWGEEAGILEIALGSRRYHAGAVRRLASHFFQALEGMLQDPAGGVKDLEIVGSEERRQLFKWGRGANCYLEGLTLPQLFEEVAARLADAPALELARLEDGGAAPRWTYAELNGRANRLARYLRKRGVGANKLVGICLERSLEMVVAFWGVLKAGGACVPLDPSYPAERLAFMLEDSGAELVLTQSELEARVDRGRTRALCLEENQWREESSHNLPALATEEDLAYVIYTSGSTGRPKGVLVTHGAVANHCLDMAGCYGMTPSDRVLQFSPYNFDAAFEQIFSALLSGCCLVVRGREIWNAREFTEMAKRHRLTIADVPTAYWHELLQHWLSEAPSEGEADTRAMAADLALRLVIVGGEALLPETVELWRRLKLPGVRLLNAYGPTEATITAACHDVNAAHSKGKRISIGRVRGARELYVVDRWGHLAATGVAGELWIGGRLLARGYHGRDELTAEKFLPNPWNGGAGRVYRTGDLVRFLEDGNLEFLGRVDDQVKLRGFRIELGEIESCLLQHPGVRAAAAGLREESGGKALTGYVVTKNGEHLSSKELRQFVRGKLPDYMIPRSWSFLEQLPMSPSGKVDRRALSALPAGDGGGAGAVGKGPRNPLELQLQLIFERVLKRRPIGVDEGFFELGGDSLQALELIVEMDRVTGQSLPLGTLFQSSTVEELAGVLRTRAVATESQCLVPLQPVGKRRPLFLIHTTPGDVLGYGNLIYHLGADQPCYGFQSRGLASVDLAQTRIEEMASYYVKLLREFQPKGPYMLGGWCYGGLVAVEMAAQLRRSGEEVALLALLETVAPAPSLRVYRYYLHRLGCFFRMRPARWWIYVREKIRYYREARIANRMRFREVSANGEEKGAGPAQREARLSQLEHVYFTNLRALRQYRAKFYPGKVTLFNASEQDPALIPDPEYGWPGLAGEIEIHTVPGNHDTMLAEPHVKVLADKIRWSLDRAQTNSI